MILLARHGQTDANVPPPRVQGSLDFPVTARGREQASELARKVAGAGVAALHTSHLGRARETAEIVAAELALEPRVDERLAESHRGAWEGRLIRDIQRDDPDGWAAWLRAGEAFRFPEGESLAEHRARVVAALADVMRGPLPALVVCHGGTIRCAVADRHPRGLEAFHELEVPNGAVFRLEAAVAP